MDFGFITSRQSDERLMQRAAEGSERAFEELYKRYARRLQGFFWRQMSCRDIASDLTQDVFLRAYAARHTWQNGKNVESWLFTIAYNLCRNTWRHQQIEAGFRSNVTTDEYAMPSVEVDLDRDALDSALHEVLESLDDENRLLFSLRYEEEQTVPQIAVIIGVPEGTVKSRLHKLINIIKHQLKRYENR